MRSMAALEAPQRRRSLTGQQCGALAGYSASVRNLAQISYASDNVFSDGTALQMASVTGNATDGYVMTLTVAVNA